MGAEDCRNVDAPRGFDHLVNVPGISEINYISDPTASRLCYADITAIPHCDSHRNPPDSNDNSLICKTIWKRALFFMQDIYLHTALFVHSVARVFRWGFGEFPQLVGCYCSYLLLGQSLATFSNHSNKTLRQSGWIALKEISHRCKHTRGFFCSQFFIETWPSHIDNKLFPLKKIKQRRRRLLLISVAGIDFAHTHHLWDLEEVARHWHRHIPRQQRSHRHP